MGGCLSNNENERHVPELTQYERLDRIESVFLRDIEVGHDDYQTAQKILKKRTLNQYAQMMIKCD